MAIKKVLIVEDDATLAGALAAAVHKVGYEATLCTRPAEAVKALDEGSFQVAFIDCLLPETPGIELAKEIRKNFNSEILTIVLMSGIFTDKQMMREMATEVTALDFLKKPFEINEVLKYLEKDTATKSDQNLAKTIFTLPDRVGANPSRISEILKDLNRINGFEIPILLATTVANGYSGIIRISSETGDQTSIIMRRGSIFGVESPDATSYLGKLLVVGGWVLPSDLELILLQQSEKKLGQRLIEENLVSPHALMEVMAQQMALRLAKILRDQSYSVSFERNLSNDEGPSIDPTDFYPILDDLICSRIPDSWLTSLCTNWQDYTVRLAPSHSSDRAEYRARSVLSVDGILESIERIGVLSSLLQSFQENIEEFHRAFYYLLCWGRVLFSEKVSQMSEAERIVRLQKFWNQFSEQSLIEVFQTIGGNKGMSAADVRGIYTEFVQRHLGPLPASEANAALVSVYESVRGKLTEALELFLNPSKLTLYEREIEANFISQRTSAQSKADEAKKYLAMRQYANAIVLINKATELNPKLEFLALYSVWAKVGLFAKSKNRAKDLREIEQLLSRVSSEEKISALGNFVQGLFAKAKGEAAVARKFFESALAIDKSLIEARREINALPAPTRKPVRVLHDDLGSVIGNLFKKS